MISTLASKFCFYKIILALPKHYSHFLKIKMDYIILICKLFMM